jgi:hypothetical protein
MFAFLVLGLLHPDPSRTCSYYLYTKFSVCESGSGIRCLFSGFQIPNPKPYFRELNDNYLLVYLVCSLQWPRYSLLKNVLVRDELGSHRLCSCSLLHACSSGCSQLLVLLLKLLTFCQ